MEDRPSKGEGKKKGEGKERERKARRRITTQSGRMPLSLQHLEAITGRRNPPPVPTKGERKKERRKEREGIHHLAMPAR